MQVSVVVCTYAPERYDDFVEAVESVLEQTYDSLEVVLVVDGTEEVYEQVQSDFGALENVVTHCNDENRGVSASRTTGAELASGDVVAFIDDDAIAEPNWAAELVAVYESTDALAVGGRMVGEWLAGRPWFLPEEFYWLVGVTYPGFAEDGAEVRNTFESNISFRRDVFLELGGFDPDLGPTADEYSHSEGAEIGARLRATYGRGVVYTADAVVRHKVFEHRIQFSWLCKRAFEQGQSKRAMERRDAASAGEEYGYLRMLFTQHVPRRIRQLLQSPSSAAVVQFLMMFVFTLIVGVGYVHSAAMAFRGE
ncbi:glucosyl-dolichyl phosphate glucuronosyltransferase [Natrarchaeobaculum aegyptiacum]|uniref:Glycosyl transferase family A n=1 Tax=Natrarchaeobaculum aegyptiacum TaxID=745377 RepID=A0A2Z2HVL3_9EURY|nr:glucosyl-dolichyl phosphate glucuronosyltransferase [Natrarchaeobaculum aegyptiacum]ARS90813.1 glycosyl transferase family A [Natrarchaeobaculum aegyptiacum]